MTAEEDSPAEKAEWKRGKHLGKGGFGEVFLAVPTTKRAGRRMAVKTSPESTASSLIAERRLLEKLALSGVPGIVRCLGGGPSESRPGTYELILEYATCGSLHGYITRINKSGNRIGIPDTSVRNFTHSILTSLSAIHRLGVAHCDIKPANILVFPPRKEKRGGFKTRNDGEFEVKLADFGVAVEMESVVPERNYCRGTVKYMAPEMVVAGEVTLAADVWSLGCTVVEMVTGDPPWKGRRSKEEELKKEIEKGCHPEIPEWLCEEGKDFLWRCFEKSPNRRPSAEVLLQHQFVGGGRLPDAGAGKD